MAINEFCHRNVVCATRDTTITEAANLMRQHHIGDVIIVETRGGKQIPIGIVTDRDIVVEVIAAGIDPRTLRLGDLRLAPLVTVDESTSYAETVSRMSAEGVRRFSTSPRRWCNASISCARRRGLSSRSSCR